MVRGRTLHNGNLIPQGFMPVVLNNLLQVLQPFTTSTGHAGHGLLIHWSSQLQSLHIKADTKPTSTLSNYSTGHLFSTLLLVYTESFHKRSIQGLQTTPQTAPVPCSACLLSTWAGRGFPLNTCSHCGLWKKKIRWGEHHAYPVTAKWLCCFTLCIKRFGLLLGKNKLLLIW